MDHGPFEDVYFLIENGGFSIAMLVYQRLPYTRWAQDPLISGVISLLEVITLCTYRSYNPIFN